MAEVSSHTSASLVTFEKVRNKMAEDSSHTTPDATQEVRNKMAEDSSHTTPDATQEVRNKMAEDSSHTTPDATQEVRNKMAEDSSHTKTDPTPSSPLVQSTGHYGGQDTTCPNFNNPNALDPNFNNPNALDPNFNNPNALDPNFNNPKALGPNFNNPKALGPNFNNPKALDRNFNWNAGDHKMMITLVLCCGCCCCLFFFIIPLIGILTAADPPDYRIPAPGGVDFGPSRFDASCSYTYRPQTAVTKRQTAGNRSFVTHGLETVPNTYEYLVFELCSPSGENRGVCTGSIIDSRHVLTAAHCVAEENRTGVGSLKSDFIDKKAVVYFKMAIVKAYSNDPAIIQHSQVAGADAIYIHSDYDDISLGGTDIALIRLNRTLTFNDYIKPVCLAGYKDEVPGRCVVIGYGQIEDQKTPFYLYRAPNIAIHSTESCSKGELAKVTGNQIFERTTGGFLNRLRFNNLMKWFLPIFYRARLCSLTEADGSNVCSGDSGGPLMCTPGGVTSNKEYHNPKSSLFRTTDPTLKQFGINQALLNVKKCGDEGLITMFMSVKDLRLWLEFIAWPALQDPTGTKRKETTRYDACIQNFDWAGVLAAIKEGDKTDNLHDRHRVHICRKFNSYMNCADNSPKLEYCDHLISTILNTVSDVSLYVDLLPLFKAERCRQQKGAAGC